MKEKHKKSKIFISLKY